MRFLNVARANLSGFLTLWALHSAVKTCYERIRTMLVVANIVTYIDCRQCRVDHGSLSSHGEWLIKHEQHGISLGSRCYDHFFLFYRTARWDWRWCWSHVCLAQRRQRHFLARWNDAFRVFLGTTVGERFRRRLCGDARGTVFLRGSIFIIERIFWFLCYNRWFSLRQFGFFQLLGGWNLRCMLISIFVFLFVARCIWHNVSCFQRFNSFLKMTRVT